MSLYIVREESVPLNELRPGDRLILPGGRRVNFERLDEYDSGFVVRWWRPADRGEPGYRTRGRFERPALDEHDGRVLGSFVTLPAGSRVLVDRG